MELSIVLLCFATAACTFALVSKMKSGWEPERFFEKKRAYTILAACIFALAMLVRVWNFGGVPSGANQDEAMAAVDAHALADYGTDRYGMSLPVYFTAWGYGQMSVLLSYCMAPFIKVFGLSVFVIRLPMLLASLAGLWVIFRFSQKLFGKSPALVILLFVAINPWQIMQSRWSLDCNLLPHFLLFSIYFLYRGLEKRIFLYVSMLFFALTMYTYGIAFYTIPIILVALCLYLVAKGLVRPLDAWLCALTYLFFAWPIFAVVLINYFKLPALKVGPLTMALFPDSIRMNDLLIFSKDFFAQLRDNVESFFNVAFLEKGDFSWNYIPNYGHMYLFSLPFIALGFIRLLLKRRGAGEGEPVEAQPQADDAVPFQGAGRFMLLTWLAVAAFSGLMVNNVNTNRINIIWYPLCMLAGLGVWHAVAERVKVKALAAAVAVLYALSFVNFTSYYFGGHAKALANDFCSGLTDAVKYADGLGSDVVYVTAYSRSENAFTCSEIYTLLGADVDARYFQGNADAYGADGKKLLPYKQRYRYTNFSAFDFNEPIGSVYVYNMNESAYFDPGVYDTYPFGGFGVAVKVSELPPPDESGEGEVFG